MVIRYTPVAATAALMLSIVAVAMNVMGPSRVEARATVSQAATRVNGELFCMNGFAYHVITSDPDSEYGGVDVLEVMTEPKGAPAYDRDGNEYPRLYGPKACSKS